MRDIQWEKMRQKIRSETIKFISSFHLQCCVVRTVQFCCSKNRSKSERAYWWACFNCILAIWLMFLAQYISKIIEMNKKKQKQTKQQALASAERISPFYMQTATEVWICFLSFETLTDGIISSFCFFSTVFYLFFLGWCSLCSVTI